MWTKDGFQKKKRKKICLSQHDWYQLACLLESGNTLHQALVLLQLESTNIFERMRSGERFEHILCQENKGKFYDHLSFFVEVTTLQQAIFSALEMIEWEKELFKKFKKKSVYPLFIFCFSFVSIFLFSQYIIPQLVSNFQVGEDSNILFLFVSILKAVCSQLFIFSAILLFAFVLQARNHTLHAFVYRKIACYIPWCKQMIAYYLSGYIIQLQQKGMSTKQSFQYLMKMQENTFLMYTVKDIYANLQEGKDLLQIIEKSMYLDRQFKNHFLIGSHNFAMVSSLQSYMQIQMLKWEKHLHCITLSIQCVSYTLVGMLVICVYQIMLIPLQMLEQF